ncbi:hypothetical protein NC651_039882 [Populus alba x Populus x berolinensis]|nr:hypothetical protein NC651_039882 [Populus alba x Populus x berolinensis]
MKSVSCGTSRRVFLVCKDFLTQNLYSTTPYTQPILVRELHVLEYHVSGIPLVILFLFAYHVPSFRVHLDWGNGSWVSSKKMEYHVSGIPLVILFLFAYHVPSFRVHLDWGNGSWVSSKKMVNLLNCCID